MNDVNEKYQKQQNQQEIKESDPKEEEEENLLDKFVYEPISGLYYDEKSGYYYSKEYKLYYNGNNGRYYTLNRGNNQFELYPEAEANENSTEENVNKNHSLKCEETEKKELNCDNVNNRQNEKDLNNKNSDREEGEIISDSDNDLDTKNDDEHKSTSSFIEDIREAAESAQISNGFIYEPTSGLFYDKNTGYYYNAECGLYYDGNTGSYYKLNQNTGEYELYCQGQHVYKSYGKLYNTPNENDDKNVNNKKDDFDANNYEDYQKPALRLIVKETNLSNLKVGCLFIIDYKGGTLGREGNKHNVIIPDEIISKYHLKFTYNDKIDMFQCIDLGSRNGTILNNKRMSSAKQESEPFNIEHGSIIELSKTKLLCHIHKGYSTCLECTPKCEMENKSSNEIVVPSREIQLRKIKKKYGLNVKDQIPSTDSNKKYIDRAENRRKAIGSTSEHEKTQMSSTETELQSDNKGFKLLQKFGWKKGQGLGKNENGIQTPINSENNEGTKGLGCKTNDITQTIKNNENSTKIKKWQKAQERYKNLHIDGF